MSQSVLTALEYMETLALQVNHQAAKEGAAGGAHMKETQTPIPWQVAKSKIEDYTSKWKLKWITSPHYKHKKLLFYESQNKTNQNMYKNGNTHAKYMD